MTPAWAVMHAGEVHVWLARPAPAGDLWDVLDDAERRRAERFLRPQDRAAFVAAHALVRAALSSLVPDVAPERWEFTTGLHGRPEVAGPATGAPLHFNLSHTDGLVGCVVAPAVECGLDLEPAEPRADVGLLSRTCLADGERAALARAARERRRELFVRFWTLKEAYAKALGLGLFLPFDTAAFALQPRPHLVDAREGWWFEQWRASPGHIAALAVRSAVGGRGRVVVHELAVR